MTLYLTCNTGSTTHFQ